MHAFSTFYAGIVFNSFLWEHICTLNVRLGGEADQQNVIIMQIPNERTLFKILEFTVLVLSILFFFSFLGRNRKLSVLFQKYDIS